jgi:hypothetical protein
LTVVPLRAQEPSEELTIGAVCLFRVGDLGIFGAREK